MAFVCVYPTTALGGTPPFIYLFRGGSGGGGGFQSRFFRQREILHARTYCTRPKVTNQRGKKKTAGEGNVLRKSD